MIVREGHVAERLIALRDVLSRTTLSKTHTYRLINSGNFPRPVPLGPRRVAFLEREVDEWLQTRVQARTDSFRPAIPDPSLARRSRRFK